uniref:Zinc knuckle CX2CX4HX4C n=1 Tax=Tanacetum cinerariifolium TaxID=118510 RepID=A0A6L2JZB6_TANCI|nr:zinc knuckle CX2CX4HX4C [Tanacetum cinerariifolium]
MESHTGVVEDTLCLTDFTINTNKPTTPLHGSYPLPSEVTGISSKVDLVSRSLHVLCIPGTVNVVALLGVQLNTLGDIDNLTKDIELGKLELWPGFPSEKKTGVLETIWSMWDAFLAKNSNVLNEDGISLIATFIGKPVMLDSYISSMCNDSRGRSSFARCLTEVNSEADHVDVITIGIPSFTVDDFTKETIHVEYE